MLFNSIKFIVLFPIILIMYFLLPGKIKKVWLLICSYLFYALWNPAYVILLMLVTAVTYFAGLFIGNRKEESYVNQKKLAVAVSFVINIGLLGYFKYWNFLVDNVAAILTRIGVPFSQPGFSIVLPVGISFYVFQSLTYVVDVYRNDCEVEKNIINYALFVSFFPNILSGPIEKAKHFIPQLHEDHSFDYDRMKRGMLLMLWGYFLKVVVTDRMSILVDSVFDNYASYAGIVAIAAAVFFTLQIYCDFASYSCLASGIAEVLGFELIRNFDQPYFAVSVADFWRRWHISLSSWFKEYLYFPLGGSRKGKIRQYINVMIVFLVSGLWHGASWHFVAWGFLNGAFQVVGGIVKPFKKSKALQISGTFILMTIAWVFFRAQGIMPAVLMIKSMVTGFDTTALTNGSLLDLGIDIKDYIVIVISLIAILIVDIVNERGYRVRDILMKQKIYVQWPVYLAAIFIVLIFGVYGPDFITANFLYFQF